MDHQTTIIDTVRGSLQPHPSAIPKAFISYSWDNEEHRRWVRELATRLRSDGVDITLDQWDTAPGDQLPAFMERAIRENDFVLIVCTPHYKEKSDSRLGGVGYEGDIMTAEVSISRNHRKFIPLLRKSNWINAAPSWLSGKYYIDLREDPFPEQKYHELLSTLQGRREKAPPLGSAPASDPFQKYLNTLYHKLVTDYFQKILIDLQSEATPEAVISETNKINSQALPVGFVTLAEKDKPEGREYLDFKNFNQVMNQYDGQVLLLGDPGAGKTTTLMMAAREAVVKRMGNPSYPLPIVAPVLTWDAIKNPPLGLWLSDFTQDWLLDSFFQEHNISQLITEGKAILFLDGLDELKVEKDDLNTRQVIYPRRQFLNILKRYLSTSKVKVVLTCRSKDYKESGTKIALRGAVTLKPLSNTQMKKYLANDPNLWRAVKSDPALGKMLRIPLLLSLIRFAYAGLGDKIYELRDLQSSPEKIREAIIKSYITRRYEHEQRKAGGVLPYSLEEVKKILGQATLILLRDIRKKDHNIFDETILDKIIEIGKNIEFLDFAQQLNLLISLTSTKYQFIHLYFRDYFAYTYSLSCLKDLSSGDRSTAARILGSIKDERALIPLMNSLLSDPDPEVRAYSARALGLLACDEAIEPLINALQNDKSALVCAYTIKALGRIGNMDTYKYIIEALEKDIEILRIGVRATLGRRYPALAEPVINLIESNIELGKRVTLIVLGIENPDIPYILQLTRNTDQRKRMLGVYMLGHVENRAYHDRIIGALMLALRDTLDAIVLIAIDALRRTEDNRTIPQLCHILNHPNKTIRLEVEKALDDLGHIPSNDAENGI